MNHPHSMLNPIRNEFLDNYFSKFERSTTSKGFMDSYRHMINKRPAISPEKLFPTKLCLKEDCIACSVVFAARQFKHVSFKKLDDHSNDNIYHSIDHYLCKVYSLIEFLQDNHCRRQKANPFICSVENGKKLLTIQFSKIRDVIDYLNRNSYDPKRGFFLFDISGVIKRFGEVPMYDEINFLINLYRFRSSYTTTVNYYKNFENGIIPKYISSMNLTSLDLEYISNIPCLVEVYDYITSKNLNLRSNYFIDDDDYTNETYGRQKLYDIAFQDSSKQYFNPFFAVLEEAITNHIRIRKSEDEYGRRVERMSSFFKEPENLKQKLAVKPIAIWPDRMFYPHILNFNKKYPIAIINQILKQVMCFSYFNGDLAETHGHIGLKSLTLPETIEAVDDSRTRDKIEKRASKNSDRTTRTKDIVRRNEKNQKRPKKLANKSSSISEAKKQKNCHKCHQAGNGRIKVVKTTFKPRHHSEKTKRPKQTTRTGNTMTDHDRETYLMWY